MKESEVAPKTFWMMFRTLIPYLKPYKIRLPLYFLCLSIEISYLFSLPLSYRMILDNAIKNNNIHLLFLIAFFILAGLVVRTLADFFAEYLIASIGTEISFKIRFALLKDLQNQPFDYLEKAQTSELASGFSDDIIAVENAIVNTTSMLLCGITLSIISLFMLFWLSLPLAIIALILLGTSFIIPNILKSATSRAMKQRLDKNLKFMAIIHEFLTNHLIIRVYVLGQTWIKKANNMLNESMQANKKANIFLAFTPRSLVASSMLSEVVIILAGATAVIYGQMTIGTVFSFLVFTAYFIALANIISFTYPLLQKAAIGMNHINTLIQSTDQNIKHSSLIVLPLFSKSIDFSNVNMHFPNKNNVLENISLHIKAGSSIAFVGPSGSGKTTMFKLLLSLYQPTSGSITIDEKYNLNDIDKTSWYKQIAVVTQEPLLFNTSIESNIRMGKLDATHNEIIHAAMMAGLDKDIPHFSHGYDTEIGDLGNQLSTGQKQRIAIARALIRKPKLLLLDEITSSLDAITETEVELNLETYTKNCTTITITHRLQLASKVDHIYVFNHGSIVEEGTHADLLGHDGLYTKLWNKQHAITLNQQAANYHIDINYLKAIPFLKNASLHLLQELSLVFMIESYLPNQFVFHQGEPGDKFYIISRGQVQVSSQTGLNKNNIQTATLYDGDYFGEMALISNEPRSASIQTITPCVFLTLTKPQFEKLILTSSQLRNEIETFIKRDRTFG